MAIARLTDKLARSPAPAEGQIEFRDDVLSGYGLRISAGGSRTYFVMVRANGRLVRRTVGKAIGPSDVSSPSGIKEADARRKATALINQLRTGDDPGATRRARKAAPAAGENYARGTFGWVAERYLADTLESGGALLKSKGELERKLKVDLVDWHARPIGDIKGREIRELVREKAQTSPVSANRLLSFIKRVFRWAAGQDYVETDPAAGVDKPGRESARDRYLSEDEVRLFWKSSGKLPEPLGRLVRMMLITGQRRGEVAGMLFSELGQIDYRTKDERGKDVITTGAAWMIPAARTKRGVAHTVPLSTLATEIIEGVTRLEVGGRLFDHVFPSGRRGDQAFSGWSGLKERLDEEIGKIIAEEASEEFTAEKHRIPDWHLHDLRATTATHMEMPRLAVPRQVISRILNHSEGDGRSMTARYTRHSWDKEAADALEAWSAELLRIVGKNVIALSEVNK